MSAASFALADASEARTEASSASFVRASAFVPSRSTRATSSSIFEVS
ncbi:hypothetical protein ABZW32_30310 [Streptomyces sp. NPDC004667]